MRLSLPKYPSFIPLNTRRSAYWTVTATEQNARIGACAPALSRTRHHHSLYSGLIYTHDTISIWSYPTTASSEHAQLGSIDGPSTPRARSPSIEGAAWTCSVYTGWRYSQALCGIVGRGVEMANGEEGEIASETVEWTDRVPGQSRVCISSSSSI
ncbi:hypothetical protein PENSPDRAFT_232088 [Peniophora sp. CONT]|nr:hypothetical protein PENSPDRAFT_232088 [Peniophora sp. CONT]